jgi:hypothetical protein
MNVITGADFTEAMFKPLKPIIINTLLTHFYTKNIDGSRQQLEAHEYEDIDLRGTVSLLRDSKYLVWYHHLHTTNDLLTKQAAKDAKET